MSAALRVRLFLALTLAFTVAVLALAFLAVPVLLT